ncbi:uncharacterized protein EAF01_004213 [Botrytis porri]|uniref:NmrA-like domain-containing protein n=1 Tax=Botrytis porri TaxID=87229 RepID=A0A4Z1KW10_9HELO|nr:uncharacterized protein EAF01_004213 [Botrytis porri]KAF7908458.1 hypothetical protein EAF01_004213 [Botrytis porri]TGO88707.1 hypothetical protein BPOR_0146g00100 [Botrytis porri]
MKLAFSGVDKLLLMSTPQDDLDYHNVPHGQGREKHNFAAIDAARESGVKYIVYASLAFGLESKAGVMRAHLRTEAYLTTLADIKWTIVREGLYQESWPLYAGFYDTVADSREEVVVAGDGGVSMISLEDLGIADALVLVDRSGMYEEEFLYLSPRESVFLNEVLKTVSRIKGREIRLKIVSEWEYVEYYAEKGFPRAMLEWWVSSYMALSEKESVRLRMENRMSC